MREPLLVTARAGFLTVFFLLTGCQAETSEPPVRFSDACLKDPECRAAASCIQETVAEGYSGEEAYESCVKSAI